MSATTMTSPPVPGFLSNATFHRLTVQQYHCMIEKGILTENDPVELLEGYLVLKMPRSPEHDSALSVLQELLGPLRPPGYIIRGQRAATIDQSEPEPDLVVARGDRSAFRTRHPGPADTALVVEVSSPSLARDRGDKARIYAQAGIPVYWVVNVIDRQIEVFTQPSGPTAAPVYAHQDVFPLGTDVPVVLDGVTVGAVAVSEVVV